MKIAIVGLGGVGGYIGGKLAANEGRDYEVDFIARGNHLKQIKEYGLTIKTDREELVAFPDQATDIVADIGPVDLIIMATKGYDLDSAAQQINNLVTNKTIIMPLMNGIDHFNHLENIFPDNLIVEACIYILSHIESPGVIRETGDRCKIIMGKTPTHLDILKPMEKILLEAGIPTILQDSPAVDIWSKFLLISSLACTTSLYRQEVGLIMDDSEKLQFFNNILSEVESIARAKGIDLPADITENILASVKSMPYNAKTSMQRDFEKGINNELEALCGAVVRLGQNLKVPTPLYEYVYNKLR